MLIDKINKTCKNLVLIKVKLLCQQFLNITFLELGHEVLGFYICLFGNAYGKKYVTKVEERNIERMEFLHEVGIS
jgi:uncharacterized membrane protein YiaA